MTSTPNGSGDTKAYGQTFRHILPKTLPVSAGEAGGAGGAGNHLPAPEGGVRQEHALFIVRSQ